MLCQRIYQIAAGYEDCDDADTLRNDPTFQTLVGKTDSLASQPTLSRLENHADWGKHQKGLAGLCLKRFMQHGYSQARHSQGNLAGLRLHRRSLPWPASLRFFSWQIQPAQVLPAVFFRAQSGCLLSARLPPGNSSASEGITGELNQLVPLLKRRFPKSQISYRADAGSATPEIYATLKSRQVPVPSDLQQRAFQEKPSAGLNGAKTRMRGDANTEQFFIALDRAQAGPNREKLSSKSKSALWAPTCALSSLTERAEPNKSLTTTMTEDSARTGSKNSSAIFTPTGYRATAIAPMLFGFNSTHSLTSCWVLFCWHALTPKLDLAHVRLETLRVKLFKVGARFVQSARRLWFHLSSSWPGRDLFVEVWQRLKRLPQPAPS